MSTKMKLRHTEVDEILHFCHVYDLITFQRVCKQWRDTIREKHLPSYVDKNYGHVQAISRATPERKTKMLLAMLPKVSVPIDVEQIDRRIQIGVSFRQDNTYGLSQRTDVKSTDMHEFPTYAFQIPKSLYDQMLRRLHPVADENGVPPLWDLVDSYWHATVTIAFKRFRVWQFQEFILKSTARNEPEFETEKEILDGIRLRIRGDSRFSGGRDNRKHRWFGLEFIKKNGGEYIMPFKIISHLFD